MYSETQSHTIASSRLGLGWSESYPAVCTLFPSFSNPLCHPLQQKTSRKRYIQVGRFEEGFDNTTLRLWLQPGSVYTHKPGHQITTERDCTLQGHLGREDGPAVDKDATGKKDKYI